MFRKTLRSVLLWLSRLPLAYSVLAFLVARRVAVRGWSMSPVLRNGDRVLFDRLAYVRDRPRRGDIVLAVHPVRPGVRMVKRVVGVPGDTVAIEGNRCWVNGERIGHLPGEPRGEGKQGRTLERGEYFLAGDDLDFSTDSRELGPVRRVDILARGWIVYWPADRVRRL
jgi:signal peptidase I